MKQQSQDCVRTPEIFWAHRQNGQLEDDEEQFADLTKTGYFSN